MPGTLSVHWKLWTRSLVSWPLSTDCTLKPTFPWQFGELLAAVEIVLQITRVIFFLVCYDPALFIPQIFYVFFLCVCTELRVYICGSQGSTLDVIILGATCPLVGGCLSGFFLFPSPQPWVYKQTPPLLAFWGIELESSCLQDKHFTS